MNKIDGRKLDRKTKEFIRIQAIERFNGGESVQNITRSYGYNRTSMYRWIRRFNRQGKKALKSRPIPGRKPRLSTVQQQEVAAMVAAHDPRYYGMESALWTRQLISRIVAMRFNVQLQITAVGHLLHRWGLVSKKPQRRAYERKGWQVSRWKHQQYPAIMRHARRRKAEVFFFG